MGLGDKIKNAADEAVGKVKEEWGDLTDNEKLEAEGKAEQAAANARQAGEEVKDTAGNVAEDVREGAERAGDSAKDAWNNATKS